MDHTLKEELLSTEWYGSHNGHLFIAKTGGEYASSMRTATHKTDVMRYWKLADQKEIFITHIRWKKDGVRYEVSVLDHFNPVPIRH